MNILAIDASTELISAALDCGGRFCVQAEQDRPSSEIIFDMADSLFRISGLEREAVDVFAFMQGPGSWTGLRAGFAAAEGFALAAGKLCAALPTLDCMALAAYNAAPSFNGIILPALDAKRGRVFFAIYECLGQGRSPRRLCPYKDAPPEAAAALISGGSSLAQDPSLQLKITGNAAPALFQALAPLLPSFRIELDEAGPAGRALVMTGYLKLNPGLCKSPGENKLLYLREALE